MAARRAPLCALPLEDRTTPATVTDGGGATLTITLAPNPATGAGELLTVLSRGTEYEFSTTRTFANGGVQAAGDFSAFGGSVLTLKAAALARYTAVRVVDDGPGAAVDFLDRSTGAYSDDFAVTLDDPNAGQTRFFGSSAFGANSLTVDTTERVVVGINARVTAGAGAIALRANQQQPARAGSFVGVDVLTGATVQTDGPLTLAGRGGTGATGGLFGVHVQDGARVAGGAGAETLLAGTGGAGGGVANAGVYVEGTGAVVTTAGGPLRLAGTGGGAVGASGADAYGVWVKAARVAAGGGGATTLVGNGGPGSGDTAHGVFVVNGGRVGVGSGGGPVTITGTAGPLAGFSGIGVFLDDRVQVTTGGLGAVTVTGTGADGPGGQQQGVLVSGVGTRLTSGGGPVTVTGTARGTGAGIVNIGVQVSRGAVLDAGGLGAVTVRGTGGRSAGTENNGVRVEGDDQGGSLQSVITSSGGPVTVTGVGGGVPDGAGDNQGVHLLNNGLISAGGGGAVVVDGTGGFGRQLNQGVSVDSDVGRPLVSRITSSGGPVTVTGRGAASGVTADAGGVFVGEGGVITAGGTGPVTVAGAAGPTGRGAIGVLVIAAGSAITSGGGPVTVTGTGGGGPPAAGDGYGVGVAGGGRIAAGGSGRLTVDGTGGSGGVRNDGVRVDGAASTITTAGGPLSVVGRGGAGGTASGVVVVNAAVLTAGGTAAVEVDGTGGTTGDGNRGVWVLLNAARITTGGGNLSVRGRAGAGADSPFVLAAAQDGAVIAAAPPGVTAIADATGTSPPPPPAPVAPQFTSPAARTFVVGTAGTFTVTAGGTPAPALTVAGGLPPGVTFDPATGVLSGTPAAGSAGTFPLVFRATNAAGAAEQQFTLTVSATPVGPPPPPPAAASPRLIGYRQFAAGAGAGGGGVTLYNPDRSVRLTADPFPGAAGGVRTAAADFTGDGIADLVVGTGPGVATRVRVLDGATQQELFAVSPFEAAFVGGVFVAAGDLTGDGVPELVITPDEGGGPRVRVFDGRGVAVGAVAQLADFFGIDDDNFRGGARPAVGDLNGDGAADLVVAAGFGGGPRVALFDGRSLGGTRVKLVGDFFVFEEGLRNGAYVAVGDLDADGKADLIAGGGPGGGPRVRAFSGADVLARPGTPADSLVSLANFFAGDPNNRSGVRVAVKDLDNDNRADVVASGGPGSGSRVTSYAGKTIAPNGPPPELLGFDAFGGFAGGVFVG